MNEVKMCKYRRQIEENYREILEFFMQNYGLQINNQHLYAFWRTTDDHSVKGKEYSNPLQ